MSQNPEIFGLITADWHIRRHDQVWQQHPALLGDNTYGITQIAELIHARSIPRIFALGDIFEERPQHSDAIVLIRKFLDQWEKERVGVWYVQGQHERARPPLLSAIHDWPQTLVGYRLETPLGLLTGLDYLSPTAVEVGLRTIPAQIDVLATHQVWQHYFGENHAQANANWLPERTQHIWTGDCHQHRQDTFEGRTFTSPGPLAAQDLREFGPKGVWLLHEDGSWESVPLRTRRYHECRVETEEQLTQLLDTWNESVYRVPQSDVPAQLQRPVLRVRYRSDLPEIKQKLESRLGVDVFLFLTPLPTPSIRRPEDEQRARIVIQGGMEGCLATYYEKDPLVLQTALRLWRTPDVQEEIRMIAREGLSVPNP